MPMTEQDCIDAVLSDIEAVHAAVHDQNDPHEPDENSPCSAFINFLLTVSDHQEQPYTALAKPAARQWLTANVSGLGNFDGPAPDIDPTPDKKHPGLKYQIMVCTRCLLMPADLKPDHVTNTTSSYEDGVFYITPHADTCIRIMR